MAVSSYSLGGKDTLEVVLLPLLLLVLPVFNDRVLSVGPLELLAVLVKDVEVLHLAITDQDLCKRRVYPFHLLDRPVLAVEVLQHRRLVAEPADHTWPLRFLRERLAVRRDPLGSAARAAVPPEEVAGAG